MKNAALKFLKKGQEIVDMNHKAIDAGFGAFKKYDVPADWANATDNAGAEKVEGPQKLVEQVEKEVYTKNSEKNTKIVIAKLGNDAGIIGAAMVAR